MAEKIVALQMPVDLAEKLRESPALVVEYNRSTPVSDPEFEAIVPDGMKKVIGGAILVTVILKGAGAAVELATAIDEYVDRTGNSVEVVDPDDGSLLREIVRGITLRAVQDAIEESAQRS